MSFPGLGLPRWAAVLRNRIITDKSGEDSATEAARALVEVLDAEHVERLADALFEVMPGLRERFTRTVLEEIREEIVRREDSTLSHSIVELITNIENDWRNQQ